MPLSPYFNWFHICATSTIMPPTTPLYIHFCPTSTTTTPLILYSYVLLQQIFETLAPYYVSYYHYHHRMQHTNLYPLPLQLPPPITLIINIYRHRVHFYLLVNHVPPVISITLPVNECCCSLSSHRPRAPLRWLDPGAFGTLGVGGGFAIGAKLCRPDSEVWIIYGDGSCGYSVAEIDTLTRHKVRQITFILAQILTLSLSAAWAIQP